MSWSLSRFLVYAINFVLAFVELFIVLRIILKLFGANPEAPFVSWVYETSRGLVAPFLGMFPAPTLTGGFVIEFSSIFALIVYAVFGYLLVELIEYVSFNSDNYRVSRTVVTKR